MTVAEQNKRYREKHWEKIAAQKKRWSAQPEVRLRERLKRAAPLGKCRKAISESKSAARKKGHVACNASVEELMASYTNACHICKREALTSRGMCMDHNHITGKFRGWLCDPCNIALGKMQDSSKLLRVAADYLDR